MGRPRNKEPYKKCSFELTEETFSKFNKYCEDNMIYKSKLLEKIVVEFLKDKV